MKNLAKLLIPIFLLIIVILPTISLAQGITPPKPYTLDEKNGLVPCGNEVYPQGGDKAGQPVHPCNFNGFMNLINNVIGFVLFYLAIPLSAIMFAYAGFTMVTSGGAEGKTKAKNIFTSTVIGLLCSAGAYLIIKTILHILGFGGDWLGF
jgi:amino acid transporter